MTSILDYMNNVIWKLLKLSLLITILVLFFQAIYDAPSKSETISENSDCKYNCNVSTQISQQFHEDMASLLRKNKMTHQEYLQQNAFFIGAYARAAFICPGDILPYKNEIDALENNIGVRDYFKKNHNEATAKAMEGTRAVNESVKDEGLIQACENMMTGV